MHSLGGSALAGPQAATILSYRRERERRDGREEEKRGREEREKREIVFACEILSVSRNLVNSVVFFFLLLLLLSFLLFMLDDTN